MQVIYVSGPYSAPTENQLENNIDRAREAAQRLWDMGYAVICPHLNSAHMTGSHEMFIEGDCEIIKRLAPGDALYMLRGWIHSRGSRQERRQAKAKGLRIYHQGWDEPPGPEWVIDGTMEVAYA
jgi:hypothetical protein